MTCVPASRQVLQILRTKGESLWETKKMSSFGIEVMYALKDEAGSTTNNAYEIIKLGKRYYADLYSTDVRRGTSIEQTNLVREVPAETKYEGEKTPKAMKSSR